MYVCVCVCGSGGEGVVFCTSLCLCVSPLLKLCLFLSLSFSFSLFFSLCFFLCCGIHIIIFSLIHERNPSSYTPLPSFSLTLTLTHTSSLSLSISLSLSLSLSSQIIAVLEELGRRRGLLIALSDRDEETLEPLLSFTASHIHVPRHTPILLGVANLLIDVYSGVFGQSEQIDDCFRRLQGQVEKEVRNQKVLSGLVGQIDAVMYRAEIMGSGGE